MLKKLLSSPIIKVGLKLIDNVALGGAIHNLKGETTEHPKGKMDWVTLGGSLIIPAVLIYLFATGKISMEQVEQLNELTK